MEAILQRKGAQRDAVAGYVDVDDGNSKRARECHGFSVTGAVDGGGDAGDAGGLVTAVPDVGLVGAVDGPDFVTGAAMQVSPPVVAVIWPVTAVGEVEGYLREQVLGACQKRCIVESLVVQKHLL